MKHNARNDIPATIIAIKRGDIMAQVDVELVGTGYHMSSVMTVDSLNELGLTEGDTVRMLAKAVNVLLVKP